MSVHLNVGRKRLGHAAIVPSRVSQGRQRQCQIKQSTSEVNEQNNRERLQEKYTVDISFSSSFTCDLDNDPAFMSALDQIEKSSNLRETSKATVIQAANQPASKSSVVQAADQLTTKSTVVQASNKETSKCTVIQATNTASNAGVQATNKGSDAGLHHVQVHPHRDTHLSVTETRPAVSDTPTHRKRRRRHSPGLFLSTSPLDVSIDIPIDMSTPVETRSTSVRTCINSAQMFCKLTDSRKKSSTKEASATSRKRKASYDETPSRMTRASTAKKQNKRRPVLDFSGGNLSSGSHSVANKNDFFKSLLLGNSSMETEQYSVCDEIKLQNTDTAAKRTSAGTERKSSETMNIQTLTDVRNQKIEKQGMDSPAINNCKNSKNSDIDILQANHGQEALSCTSKTDMRESEEGVDTIKDAPCGDASNVGAVTREGTGSTSVLSAPPSESSAPVGDHLCLSGWGLPDPVLQQYHKRGITHMFPWQAECLLTGNVLNGGNLVYSAPTSAGKTMVAELLVLKRVLEARKKAIIILPFVSVTREKMFYLQELYQDAGVRVSGFMGHHMPTGGFSSVDVAVCTIEKGNGLINRLLEENKLDQLGVIVVDELHLVGDPHRGYLLELLLTKIAYMSHKAQRSDIHNFGIQVVGMSATLPNLDLLARWLHADLYHTDYRPVPLTECVKIGTAVYNSNMTLLRDIDITYAIKDDEEHVVPLCIETIRDGHSILIFCPTKNWCEKLAQTVARSLYNLLKDPAVAVADTTGNVTTPGLLVLPLNKQLVKDVLEQLRRTPVGLDGVLGLTVPYGVAYHHAGLTFDERDVVEGAFRQGTLKVLIATSTLSSGVNLPARRVIIRTPVFHGHIIDFLTYKQMIGRAGRKGVDTAGESILLCKANERAKAKQLVGGVLPPVQSTLIRHQGEELSTSLKRAILEVVVSGVAQSRDDVAAYASCTLLAASVPPDAGNHRNYMGNQALVPPDADENQAMGWKEALIQQCIDFLQDNEFVCLQATGQADGMDSERFTATQLGSAVLASSLSPDEGLIVFSELQRARQSFVLENELHIIYQVTPIYSQAIAEGIDWYQFFCIWERLSAGMRRVAELVGVQETFLARAVRGRILTKTESQCRQVAIHKRFYTALVLHDLVQEMSLSQVAGKYNCNKGQLQALQQSAATFAGMVTVFCARLGWSNLELILSQFQRRLTFGVQRELCDLVRISALNGQRARLMFNGGYQTVAALATAQPENVETLLKNSAPFQSKKKQESETEWDAERRYKARCIFLTGRRGVTEHEAAVAIISEAKTIIQEELGGLGIQWQAGSGRKGLQQADNVKRGPPQSDCRKQAPLQSDGGVVQAASHTTPILISPVSGSTNKSGRGKLKRTSKSLTRKGSSPGGLADSNRLSVPCVISPPQLKQTSSIHKQCDQPVNSTNTDYKVQKNTDHKVQKNTDHKVQKKCISDRPALVISPQLKQTSNIHKPCDESVKNANTDHQRQEKCISDVRTCAETMPEPLAKATTSEASNVDASTVQTDCIATGDTIVNNTPEMVKDSPEVCKNNTKGSKADRPEIVPKHTSSSNCFAKKKLTKPSKVQNCEEESIRESISCLQNNKNVSGSSDSNSVLIEENHKHRKGHEPKHVKFSTGPDIQINTPTIEKVKQMRKFKGLANSGFKKMKLVSEKSKIEVIEICDEENENNGISQVNDDLEINESIQTKTNTTNNVEVQSNAGHALECKEKTAIHETTEVCLENRCDDFIDDFTDTFTLDTQTDIALADPNPPKEMSIGDKTSGHIPTSLPPVPKTVIQNTESLFSEDPNFDTSVLDYFDFNQEINVQQAKTLVEEPIKSSVLVVHSAQVVNRGGIALEDGGDRTGKVITQDQAVNQNSDKLEDCLDEPGKDVAQEDQYTEASEPALNEDDEELEHSSGALDRNITACSDEDMFNESNCLVAASDYERVVGSVETEMSKNNLNSSYDDLHIPYQSGQEVCFEQNDVRKVEKEVTNGGNVQAVTGILQSNSNTDKVLGEFSSQKPTSTKQFERLDVDSILALELAESFGSTFDSNEANPRSNTGTDAQADGTGKEDSLNDSLTFSMMEKVLEDISIPNEPKTTLNDKKPIEQASKFCDKLSDKNKGENNKQSTNVTVKQMEGIEYDTNVENKSSSNKNCHKPEKNSKMGDLPNNHYKKPAISNNVYKPNSKPARKTTATANQNSINNRKNMHIEDSVVTRKLRRPKTVSEHKGVSKRASQRKRKADGATDVAEGSGHNTSTGSCHDPILSTYVIRGYNWIMR